MTQEEQWLLQEKYGGEESKDFHTDRALLNSGTPLAYLIGSIPFLNCTIALDSHPLIPRPETEFWTEKAIKKIRDSIPYSKESEMLSLSILDLCAGSGAIGVAVARAIPTAQVTFSEIDPHHLPTIQKNISKNTSAIYHSSSSSRSNLELINTGKYKVIESNLFSLRSNLELEAYNYILTNPPYVDPKINRAETSVKMHEPHIALYGGNNGMEYIEQIITQAPLHLLPSGELWIEHEPEQSKLIQTHAHIHNFTCTTQKDQYGVERYSILVLQ